MGGLPKKADKPRPSYEDGRLRDRTIEEKQDETYNLGQLQELIKKAARGRTATPSSD